MKLKSKSHTTAAVVTIVVHTALLVFCIFYALVTPLPLPGEEGVEVQLGNGDLGETSVAATAATTPETPMPEEDEDIITNDEDEISLPDEEKTKVDEKKEDVAEKIVEEQPYINPNALYKGKSNKGNDSVSNDDGEGMSGSPHGTVNSDNTNGLGGFGHGTSYSLAGRKATSLPLPEYSSQDQGIIVVEIFVDKKGNVIRAEAGKKGTTISNQTLWQKTYEAAMKTKFSVNETAADEQKGTITYSFRRLNE